MERRWGQLFQEKNISSAQNNNLLEGARGRREDIFLRDASEFDSPVVSPIISYMSVRCRSFAISPGLIISFHLWEEYAREALKTCCPRRSLRTLDSNAVFLNVYDLDEGVVRLNTFMSRIGIGGAFHVGVSVFGKEYYYSGIGPPSAADDPDLDPERCLLARPTHHDVHVYRESAYLGSTALTERHVYELVRRLGKFWTVGRYDLLRRNCCQFAEAFADGLGVGPIPKEFYVLSRRLAVAADSLGGAIGAVVDAVGWVSQPTPDRRTLADQQFADSSNSSVEDPVLNCEGRRASLS
ncbi:hypothetical protein FOZ60_017143 [Perkinsus olseni]|uniref:PPPDE domain-containing protein n=1 Tax=Perkinsus olseni TaxID=32597 RepID=A0A7J6P3I3_PEROL|nr:hypothetical protein FOZ60_017143 [Perkinsus olseni]